MPRTMGDNGEAFRAVITRTTTHTDGRVTSHTSYEGPYATVGAAKSRITWSNRRNAPRYRNAWDGSETVYSGHVEKAVTNWEPVDSPPTEETIPVLKSTFASLCADSRFLSALRAAGVDNWSGYDYACESLDDDDE